MLKRAILVILLLVTSVMIVSGQEATPEATGEATEEMGQMPPAPVITGDIIAEGINGPQGLYVDADGNVYVVDGGMGGDEVIAAIDLQTGEPADVPFGLTSQILKIAPDGTSEVVGTLPSVLIGEGESSGAARVTDIDGTLYATVGAWQEMMGEEVAPLFANVVRIEEGAGVAVADTWAFEVANNPDGTGNLESHPYGIATGPDGMLYVADAAANALLRIDPATGEIELVATFEALPGVFPDVYRDNALLTDPVPTAVAFGPDGTIYVSLLSGAPFIPGSSKIVTVAEDGTVADFATGLTMTTDIKVGPDGLVYAAQFGQFAETGPVFNSGSVVRITAEGTPEVVVEGLPFVSAIGVNADGDGFVAINGIGAPGSGAVVRYTGLTSMEGTPLPMMAAPMDEAGATPEVTPEA
jgi:hypothetical protein